MKRGRMETGRERHSNQETRVTPIYLILDMENDLVHDPSSKGSLIRTKWQSVERNP